jgi:hypothetical protein
MLAAVLRAGKGRAGVRAAHTSAAGLHRLTSQRGETLLAPACPAQPLPPPTLCSMLCRARHISVPPAVQGVVPHARTHARTHTRAGRRQREGRPHLSDELQDGAAQQVALRKALDALHHGRGYGAGAGLVESGGQPGVAQRLLGARPRSVVLRGTQKGGRAGRGCVCAQSRRGAAGAACTMSLFGAPGSGTTAIDSWQPGTSGSVAADAPCCRFFSTAPPHTFPNSTHPHATQELQRHAQEPPPFSSPSPCLVQQRAHKVLGLLRHLLPSAASKRRLLPQDALPDHCGGNKLGVGGGGWGGVGGGDSEGASGGKEGWGRLLPRPPQQQGRAAARGRRA